MSVKFLNIRNKEVRVAETEPQIAALWSSSDHSPNITQGQDFGWRLAPEVVVEMKRIKQDTTLLTHIAHRYNMMLESVGEVEILHYISDITTPENAPLADVSDYSDEYDAEIRRLESENAEKEAEALREKIAPAPSLTTQTTTESLADLQKRVELEERLAVARDAGTTTTTTTENPAPNSTTTTTTKKK